MKKAVLILTVFALCFSFASCNKSSDEVSLSTVDSTTETIFQAPISDETNAANVPREAITNNTNAAASNGNLVQNNQKTKATTKTSQTVSSTKQNDIEPTTAPWQPRELTYYALSDISWQTSENINGIDFCGISVENYHLVGHSFLLTLINRSENQYSMGSYKYFSTTYSGIIEQQVNGQWVELKPKEIIKDDKSSVMHKNVMYDVSVEIGYYVSELENGRYRLILPIYENGAEIGKITVEFNSTKFNAETARAGTKIENAVSFVFSPPTSGMKYVYTPMKEADRDKIVELYNNFDIKVSQKPVNLDSVFVEICDSNGKLHQFSVFSDGTVLINSSYFKTPNGKEMYNLLNSIYQAIHKA